MLSMRIARCRPKVEDIGAVQEQLFGMFYRFMCIKILPSIGERVGGDICYADDLRLFKRHSILRVWKTTPRPPSFSSQTSMIFLPRPRCFFFLFLFFFFT